MNSLSSVHKVILLFIVLFPSSFNYLGAEDFKDLEETRVKVYGSEKDKKFRLDGFFIEWENWPKENPTHNHFHFLWFANSTNYPKFKKDQIFPFFSTIESKVDPRKSTNYFLLYNSSVDRSGDESIFFFPFYYSGNSKINNSNYIGIFPLFYKSYIDLNSYSASKLILPGYYNNSSEDSKNGESSNFTLSPFYVSNSTKNKANENTLSWFPVIPLYYTSEDKDNKHNNIAWIFDSNQNKSTEKFDRFWFLPFFYWEKDNYLNIFPIYFNELSKSDDTDDWFGILPPIYRSYSPDHSTFYFLNYYKSTNNLTTTKDSFTTFFPFYFHSDNNKNGSFTMVPLLYLNGKEKDSSSHTNLLILYDQELDKESSLDRLWLMPFYFYKKNTYHYIVPFYFGNDESTKAQDNITWGPFYYVRKTDKVQEKYFLFYYENHEQGKLIDSQVTNVFPFYYSWSTKNYNIIQETTESGDGFYLFPFFYRNQDTKGVTNSNLLGGISWTRDKESILIQNTFFPFRFYKKDAYSIWFPFSFQFAKTESASATGERWGAFFYSSWSPEEKNLWIVNYYSNEDKKNDYHSKTFFPIYHSWKKENSSGSLVFPLYIDADYRDEKEKDKFNNLSLNLLGIASQTSKGIFQPSISFAGGKKSKYYYLDTDISWLYYAFRISNRTSDKFIKDLLPRGKSDTSYLNLIVSKDGSNSPKVNSEKSFTREDSFNFIGVNLLFGVFGYEAADTKRHIRLLPLAWFTYDTEVDENIYAGPLPLPFVWYSSENLMYRVIFPIYGYQHSEDAERQSYGLFFFLKEALLENQSEETSVIWPFINWHKSQVKSGSRALPFYWQRTSLEDNSISDSTIVPLGLTYINQTTNEKNLTTNTWISPFLFRNDKLYEDGKIEQIFSPLALFYWSNTKTSIVDDSLFLSPIFFKYGTYTKTYEKPEITNFWMIPIVGFESKTNDDYWLNYFVIYNKSENAIKTSLTVFPFYYQTNEYEKKELVSQYHFYFPLFPILTIYKPITSENTNKTNSMISPFLFSTSINTKDELLFSERLYPIPLFYSQFDKKTDTSFFSLLLLFQYETNPLTDTYRFFPMLQFSNQTSEAKLPTQYRNWVLPFYWMSSNKFLDMNQKVIEENKFISLAYSSFSSAYDKTTVIPPLFYYSSSDKEEEFQSIFLLANHSESLDSESYNFFPFYHYFSSKPLQTSNSEANPNAKEKKNRAAIKESTPNRNLYYVNRFFPFYSYKTTESNSSNSISKDFLSLFYTSSLLYSENGDLKSSSFWIPPILFNYESTTTTSEWSWLFLIRSESAVNSSSFKLLPIFHTSKISENNSIKTKNWLFPLYYFDTKTSNKDQSVDSLTILPFLLYFSTSDKEEDYQNWILLASHKETKNSTSTNFFPFYQYYSTNTSSKGENEYKNRLLPFYSYSTRKSANGNNLNSDFLSIIYATTSAYNDKGELDYSKFWIPLALYSNEYTPTASEWSWLFFIRSASSANKESFNLYPIFHSSKTTELDAHHSKKWFFPLYYYSSDESNISSTVTKNSNDKKTVPSEKNSKQFSSLLFHYSSSSLSKDKDDYLTTFSFPIIPIIYREASSESSHTNLFYLFDRKVEEKQLTRFFLFPYYYQNKNPENENSTSYHHIFPIYFSGIDKEEFTAFITGLYLSSNGRNSYKNFLYFVEQESVNKNSIFTFNLLLRIFHYQTTDTSSNFKLIYGIGEVDLRPDKTQMNLVWLNYEQDEESNNLNLLPLYYSNVTKSDDSKWITPLLYYSKVNKKEKLEHSTLGLFYYNSENYETKETLQSVLFGIIYYKTVKPKERGYTGRGSLWGALWEYNTEEDTNYSKFSILKMLYSRREDDQGIRHRILFFEF